MTVRPARFPHRGLDRRGFLRSALVATAASATGLSARSYARVVGANDAIRVGVVGVRSRGVNHLTNCAAIPGVQIAAVCDVDARVLDERIARLRSQGHEARGFRDMRDLLADKEVDVVSLATPNHWHALGGIWALEAGKDVYVEKPVSHNVWEGRQLVRAAEKSGRIVQMGIQSRSGVGIARALEWARTEPLGRLLAVHGLCYNRRDSIGSAGGPQPVPTEIDYDLWSGPAPVVPPHRNRKECGPVYYDWHWIWHYGNGDLGNQGVHQMDIARRLGRRASSAEIRDALRGSPAAADAFERLASHVAANGVNLNADPLTLGVAPAFDPARERFIDSPAADALLAREYRRGFEVPEIT